MYSDFGALANLRTDARANSAGAMDEVASQFESLFVQMMLKSMRDATEKGGLFDSNQLDSYQQMHDQQLSLELAKQGGVGLADVIVQQFKGAQGAAASEDSSPATLKPLPNYRVPGIAMSSIHPSTLAETGAGTAAGSVKADWSAETPADFLRSLRPYAESAADELGVDADVLLAQAALETGWGKHVLGDARGSSNNFFNIKAGPDWQGGSVKKTTVEYRDGVAVREAARFRTYPSAEAAFADYADFIGQKPRYADAVAVAGDAKAYLHELQRAGYATDPSYAEKILSVKARLDVDPEQIALKNSANRPILR